MRGFAFTTRVKVAWGDMDALGHVNNTRYFGWFEQARIEYFERLGGTLPTKDDSGPILAHIACDYVRPIVYPAELEVGCRTTKIGNSSITMEYAIARVDAPDEVLARGSSVVVLVAYATGAKMRISEDLRAKIEALEGSAR